MEKQGAKRRYYFGTNWPEAPGLGRLPNKHFCRTGWNGPGAKIATVATVALLAIIVVSEKSPDVISSVLESIEAISPQSLEPLGVCLNRREWMKNWYADILKNRKRM